jgi:hypothetical protein
MNSKPVVSRIFMLVLSSRWQVASLKSKKRNLCGPHEVLFRQVLSYHEHSAHTNVVFYQCIVAVTYDIILICLRCFVVCTVLFLYYRLSC